MAVVPYVTYLDYAENVRQLMDVLSIFSVVDASMTAEELLNPGWAVTALSQDELDLTLRMLTRLVVALSSDLNCYPLGLATTVCFDINGDPIP